MTVASSYYSKLFFPSESTSDREFANELFPELDPKNGGLFSFNLEQHKVAPKLSSIVLHTPPFSFASAGVPSIRHCSTAASSFPTLQTPLSLPASNLLELSSTTLDKQRITRKRKSFSSTKQTHTCKDCHETKTVKCWQKFNNTDYRCYHCYNKTLPSYSQATHTCNTCKKTKKVMNWQRIGNIGWRCNACYQKTIPSHSKAKHTCNDCHLTKNIATWKRISRTLWRCNACYLKTLPSHARAKHTCISCKITKNVMSWRLQKVNDNEINYLCHTCYKKCKNK